MALIVLLVFFPSLAGAAPTSPKLTLFGPWATTGSQVVFVAKIRHRNGLWIEKFGSSTPRRIAPAYCGPAMGEVDQLAVGPKGSVACLEAGQGNTESYYSVAFVSSHGASRHVASAGGSTGNGDYNQAVNSIPLVFGDSTFLGYLYVTAGGVVRLMRITSIGYPRHVADLARVSAPRAVAIDSGRIAITEGGDINGGTVHVYTVGGRHVSTFETQAAWTTPSVVMRKDRIVARTTTRRFKVYTLHGQLVHSYPVRAANRVTMGLATYAGYVVYIGADKAVHALKLATGKDRIIARSGKGWFWNGLSLQAPGVVVPLTSPGRSVPVKLIFIPMAKIRAAVG